MLPASVNAKRLVERLNKLFLTHQRYPFSLIHCQYFVDNALILPLFIDYAISFNFALLREFVSYCFKMTFNFNFLFV